MLHEVVLPVECPLARFFNLAGAEVVGFEVLLGWIRLSAESACYDAFSGKNGAAALTAYPCLQGQMLGLLVPRPIVLCAEGGCAKCAVERLWLG